MCVASERRRASRISDSVGSLLVMVGAIAFVASVVITVWIVHDIGKESQIGFTTISKLQAVAIAGLTPGLLSLLVIAFGVYLQTRSTELLLGVPVDADFDVNDDDDAEDELT